METINLTLSRATRSGRIDRAYLGGLTTESIVVKWDDGEALPEGTKLALYQDETLCAAADLDDSGTATLSTDTQEIADAFQGLPVDYALNFTLYLGDDDSILAIVPAQVKKNWLDGGSHPPAPLPVYWTAEQTKAAIAEAVAKHNGEATAHADIRKAIDTHADRDDNPHRVTAEQTGAVPLLAPGEHADPDTHGKTALVTQNGDQGGFAVSGQAGAGPDDETFVTKYQRESITAFGDGADFTKVERYLIGPHNRNRPESILRIGDLAGTKPVTVTRESVAYRQKVTLALQIDRETIAHANSADAIDWVPSSKAVKAALDQKAEKTHTHTTAQVTGLDAALAQKANSADVYKKTETYSKAEVDGKVAGVYHYKGSVASRAALPQSPAVGDVYNIQDEDGQNVAWTGSAWDALGASVDLSAYYTKTESDDRYLRLTGGTLQKGATITIPYSGNVNIDGLRTRLIRGVRGDDATINGALFLNYQNTTVPTEDYLKDVAANTEKYTVFVAGWGEEALVLRKCDCDYLYAPKTHTHSDYLSLSLTDWQHIKGPISFDYAHPTVASANIYSINGLGNGTQVVEHGLLYINCNVVQDTNTYLSGMRRVIIAGHPALRKIDGDTLYAAKGQTYTKEEVDDLIAQAVAAPTAQADTTLKWHAACSMLTVTAGATLTADTTGWTDGAQLFIRLILPADYAGMADNIRLIGYAYFQPGEVYHCTAYKVGTVVYITPIVREDTP